MKWVFYVIVFVYMFYRTVYGVKPVENNLIVEPMLYGHDFLKVGAHKTISCKPPNRSQKMEWIDPSGHVVDRHPGSHVFSQEHFVPSTRGRVPALVLTIVGARLQDTGIYQCKSGALVKNVTLCVFEPSDFANTPAEVVADLGRSITLSCQAKGDPEPRLLWNRNGEIITDEDSAEKYRVMTKYNIEGFEGLLTITSLQPEDSGVYSCVSIQQSTETEDCIHDSTFNITLNVNYPPIFENGNDTKLVYGKNNQKVEIVCSANGYPAPTYTWFHLGGDVLYKVNENQIEMNEDSSQAVLTVVANQSTFGDRYKCEAKNEHGTTDKYFILLKMERPRRPSEVSLYNATAHSVDLNITWYDDIQFPVAAFEIQYIMEQTEGSRKIFPPKETSWRKSKLVEIKASEETTVTIDGVMIIGVEDLAEESAYWMRVRATNDVGESAWSDPVLISTAAEDEDTITTTTTTESPEADPEIGSNEESMNDGTFYGIFFAGGIFVVSFVCMLAMRMVK